MKIYFAGSIRGGREDQEVYFSIIRELGKHATVLTEHLGDKALTSQGEQTVTNEFIFRRDMDWVKEADLIVAEVTTPSFGVGYEIGQAQVMGKRIICLYRPIEGKRLSAMISGNQYLGIFEYKTIEDIVTFFQKTLK